MTRRTVVAAGGVLWQGDPHAPEVALVHRPAYDDWSLPKGKAKPGEHILVTAIREVTEETGHRPRIGPRLTAVRYRVGSGGKSAEKVVTYWSMRAAAGAFEVSHEVDALDWLPLARARRALTSDRDRRVLDTFARRPRDTEPLLLVRHGATAAASRSKARGGQRLNRSGRLVAQALVPVLEELGVTDLRCADVPACVDTLRPLATATGLPVHRDGRLVRDAFARDQRAAADRLRQEATASDGLVVCGQRPVLAGLLRALDREGSARVPRDATVRKGGWWLVHHRAGVVVACERHEPAA